MKVTIRADASTTIGTGHAMRMLALAEDLVARGHRAELLTLDLPPSLERRFEAAGVEVTKASATIGGKDDERITNGHIADRASDWLVLDGYQFPAGYLRSARGSARALIVDDMGTAPAEADLVLDQNLSARRRDAGDSYGPKYLFGPRYALLRPMFSAFRARPRSDHGGTPRILVTMGGADPMDATSLVLRGLAELGQNRVTIRVIVGVSHPDKDAVAHRVSAYGHELMGDVPDLAADIAWSDLVIGAAGTSALEFACVGRPLVALVLADNQKAVARCVQEMGLGVVVGVLPHVLPSDVASAVHGLLSDPERMRHMGRRGPLTVDGLGATRVVRAMETLGLTLRTANDADATLLWRWANDPQSRAASGRSEPIAWERHLAWLADRSSDPGSSLYIAERPIGSAIGILRFEGPDSEATVSINLGPDARGRGLGSRILELGLERVAAERPIQRFKADIKRDNVPSLEIFRAAGFSEDARSGKDGLVTYHLASPWLTG